MRDGDHYVVTGQKIWCSFGHIGDFGELLVRTDPDAPKHKGISWLMLPMDLPGIEVRPIETVLGSSEFCELFLDEVRVPVDQSGRRRERRLAGHERDALVRAGHRVRERARRGTPHGRGARALATTRRTGASSATSPPSSTACGRSPSATSRRRRARPPGDGAMMVKLAYTESRQKLGELSVRVLDRGALDIDNEFVEERLRTLALTIAAGTSQIQRNIIGERVLGLPKEPQWTST